MRRVAGVFASAAIVVGAGCGGDISESETAQRNPLALNVVIEKQLEGYDNLKKRSKEYIAGLGLGVAEECVVMGISPTEIESVPTELMEGEFLEGYSLVLNKQLSQSAIRLVCEDAAAQIQLIV